MRIRSLLLALGATAGLGAGPISDPAPLLRTTIGTVVDAKGNSSVIIFQLYRIDQVFAYDPRKVADAAAVLAMVKASNDTGRSISVHYFVDGAQLAAGADMPTYRIHDLTYDNKTVPIEASVPPADPGAAVSPRDAAAHRLATGIALDGDADATAARRALGDAIDSKTLEPGLVALALKTRSWVNYYDGLQNWPAGLNRDKLFMAALSDARAWQALEPDRAGAASRVAEVLSDLGAYDESIAASRDAIERWPDEMFWNEIRIARLERRRGNYQAALSALDDIVWRAGQQTGMPWHYHRGRTYLLLGQYQDAVNEFTAGLKDQPDYDGAFMVRACALGRLGRMADALADWKQVVASRKQYGNDTPPSPGAKHDNERVAAVAAALEAAVAHDPQTPTDVACTGFWDWGEDNRTRSPLLPPVK